MKAKPKPRQARSGKFDIILVHPEGGATTITISIPGAKFGASGGKSDGSSFIEFRLGGK